MGSLTFLLVAAATIISCVQAASFSNPLKEENGSDPFIVYTGGYYYLMTTTWTDVQITRAATLGGLKTGETKVVWSDSTPSRCCNVWAPEVHYLEGKWYIYYTAGRSEDTTQQRMHVLEGGATPWDSYSYASQLIDEWSIDGTILRFDSGTYMVYSCQRDGLQSLCIAPLNSPTSIGAASTLSEPTLSWETQGEISVNEGPAAMYHGGKTYLAFSASYCWSPSYQLGLLTWDGSGDPTNSSSWNKTGPVFSSANGNYGTGHNDFSFFLSPDGTEIWNVYHATSDSRGNCAGDRYTAAEPVKWNADGSPNFGTAEALGLTMAGPSGE
ncbi:hypothetical protein NU195Hw_g8445t1 [Hortaea werneckii]